MAMNMKSYSNMVFELDGFVDKAGLKTVLEGLREVCNDNARIAKDNNYPESKQIRDNRSEIIENAMQSISE